MGMPSLISAMKRDADDVELVRSILETFTSICSKASDVEGERQNDFYEEFCEILLKDKDVMNVMLECLEDKSQSIRFNVLQLLRTLEEALPAKVPSAILASPSGYSRLLELFDDGHEIIRNEAILLLRNLTATNPEIQKISVFEGTFERVFELVRATDGVFSNDTIVEDSLGIVHNLLEHNPSGQNYFLESPCLSMLAGMISPDDCSWNSQMVRNLVSVIKISCILLNRDNPKLEKLQNSLLKANLFEPLVSLALSDKVPSEARRAALNALGLLMWLNPTIQDIFARHVVTHKDDSDGHPTPAVLSVIRMAVNNDSLNLRVSATNVLSSYLRGNPDGQLVITATFKSPKTEGSLAINEMSAGSVIVDRALDFGSTHRDPYRIWFPVILLSHVLRDNDQCKVIAISHKHAQDEETEITLFSQVIWNLIESVKDPLHIHSSVAYLVLLSVWMHGFPTAVSAFLTEGANVQFLIELINQNSTAEAMIQGCAAFVFGLTILFHDMSQGQFSRQSLINIVKSRIGIDVYTARIIRTRDTLNQFMIKNDSQDYDRSFAELFLELYRPILRLFSSAKASQSYLNVDRGVETFEGICEAGGGGMSDHTLRFEMESLRLQVQELESVRGNPTLYEKNVESKCAYLTSENSRLQKLVEAYQTEIMQVEKDHEELLIMLASYDSELKQLRQHLTLAEGGLDRPENDLGHSEGHTEDGFVSSVPSQIDLVTTGHSEVAVGDARPVIPPSIPIGTLYQDLVETEDSIPNEPLVESPLPISPIKKVSDLLMAPSPSTATHDV